jgi:hypothetical protein
VEKLNKLNKVNYRLYLIETHNLYKKLMSLFKSIQKKLLELIELYNNNHKLKLMS